MGKLFKKIANWLKRLFGGGNKSPDQVDFSKLKWTYGGVNGANAKLTGAKMCDLVVDKVKLSHKWAAGSCELLGSPSPTDAVCRSCLFCRVGGVWIGGFFEWVGTTRTSRSLANISGGYKGWDYSMVLKADKLAYVIISKDGTLRSNVIVQNGAVKGHGSNIIIQNGAVNGNDDYEFPCAEFPIDQLD